MERTWKADYEKFARTARENVAATLDNMDYPALERAAELILAAKAAGKRLHISGIGKPAHLAGYAASLFSSTGTPAYFLHGTEAVHGSCGQLVPGDVVIFISNSGETAEMKATVSAVKNNGCAVIGVSGNASSWLAQQSEVHLLAHADAEGGPLDRAPRASILAETLVLQALSVLLQSEAKVTPQQYVKWHPGGSLSAADVLTYLYFKHMNIDPQNPRWEKRDRFVLSKGHAAPALYSVLANRGFFPVDELKTLRHIGSRLQGHPNMNLTPGVDMSTGSLGQGVSTAAGMALGAKRLGNGVRVYTLLGDGEIEEGQVWEAMMFASHYKLDNLLVFVDNNNLQIDGAVSDVMSPYPIDEKFAAFGLFVQTVDGHDFDAIDAAVKRAEQEKGRPSAIVLKTVKGKGVSFMENQVGWHGKAPNEEQYRTAMEELTAALREEEAE